METNLFFAAGRLQGFLPGLGKVPSGKIAPERLAGSVDRRARLRHTRAAEMELWRATGGDVLKSGAAPLPSDIIFR
jgi:hypothetical protein